MSAIAKSCAATNSTKLSQKYSGYHLRGDEDGKWVTYLGYNYNFHDLTKSELRVAPNVMDVLMASS